MTDSTGLVVQKILVDPADLKVICPGCGEHQEAWVKNPLGLTDSCDACGTKYTVPVDTPITVLGY